MKMTRTRALGVDGEALRAHTEDDGFFQRYPHEEFRVRPYYACEFPDHMGPGRVRHRAILSGNPKALPFMICVHCERGDDDA